MKTGSTIVRRSSQSPLRNFQQLLCPFHSLVLYFVSHTRSYTTSINPLELIVMYGTTCLRYQWVHRWQVVIIVTNEFLQAAIGSFQPQAFVWQVSIIVHFIPRLVIAWMYKGWDKNMKWKSKINEFHCSSYYQRVIKRNRQNVANTALLLNVIENFALLGLSVYTSNDNYGELSYHSHLIAPGLSFFIDYFRNPQKLLLHIHCRVRSVHADDL